MNNNQDKWCYLSWNKSESESIWNYFFKNQLIQLQQLYTKSVIVLYSLPSFSSHNASIHKFLYAFRKKKKGFGWVTSKSLFRFMVTGGFSNYLTHYTQTLWNPIQSVMDDSINRTIKLMHKWCTTLSVVIHWLSGIMAQTHCFPL